MCGAVFVLALQERAILPMITQTWQQQVDNGQMTPEHVERMEEPELEVGTRPMTRAGWYYLFRREVPRATALARKKR